MSDYIKRTMENTIEKMKNAFPVIMITGPRQVGKTTLLNYITSKNKNEKINYISLDDLNARALAIEDPELFLRTYDIPLIIDEFQYAPKLLSYIKIGTDLGILDELTDLKVRKLYLYTKPANMQKYLGEQYEALERDIKRAEVIKQIANEK